MRLSTKTCLLVIAATLGCTYDARQLAAPDAGAAGRSGQSPDAGEEPDVPSAEGGGGMSQGGTTGTGGALGTGGLDAGTSFVAAAGTGGATSGGRIASSGGVSAVGGLPAGGTPSAGGTQLAGATGGTTPPKTGGTVSSGGTTGSRSSAATVASLTSALAVYTKGITGGSGQLTLDVRIDNKSAQTVDLSGVTMRYWYTEESLGASVVLLSTFVGIGFSTQGRITDGKVVAYSSGVGCDHYLEVSVEGILAGQGDSSTMDQFNLKFIVHNPSFSGVIDVTNDYSYNQGAVGYNDKITLHSGGKVIWGTLPASIGPASPDAGAVVPKPDAGTSPDVAQTNTVTFHSGVAGGAMTGYGWVTMGADDHVTSPTCGPNKTPITATASCTPTSTNWDSSDALCVSGTIPALPPARVPSDLASNWGIQMGANASDPVSPLRKAYKTITLNFTGSPQTGLLAYVHRSGDPAGTAYCSPVTTGTAIALTSFNTACKDGTGTNLTVADLSKIDMVALEVPSSTSAIPVHKLCLNSIVFGL